MEYSVTAKRFFYSLLDPLPKDNKRELLSSVLSNNGINEYVLYRSENGTVGKEDLELLTYTNKARPEVVFVTLSVLIGKGIIYPKDTIAITRTALDDDEQYILRCVLSNEPIDNIVEYIVFPRRNYLSNRALLYLYTNGREQYIELLTKLCVRMVPEGLFELLAIDDGYFYTSQQLEIERDFLRVCGKELKDFNPLMMTRNTKKRREYLMTIDQV